MRYRHNSHSDTPHRRYTTTTAKLFILCICAVCYRRRFQIKVWAIYLSLADLTSLLHTRGTSKNTFELATNKLLQVASGFSDKRPQARETPLMI